MLSDVFYAQGWSTIVHGLVQNAALLSKHLTTFAGACSATEIILFDRNTFLMIAVSSHLHEPTSKVGLSTDDPLTAQQLPDTTRYERTSEIIKAFKHSCSHVHGEFYSLEMELYDFTAVLDRMTKNSYVLIIVHDPTIGISTTSLFFRSGL